VPNNGYGRLCLRASGKCFLSSSGLRSLSLPLPYALNSVKAHTRQKVIHNPELLGSHTETLGLVAPGDWVDFFRYVGETYNGIVVPEHDDRDLKVKLIQKLMAAKHRFDVHFQRDYTPPEVGA
jgi:hypothetical protein